MIETSVSIYTHIYILQVKDQILFILLLHVIT